MMNQMNAMNPNMAQMNPQMPTQMMGGQMPMPHMNQQNSMMGMNSINQQINQPTNQNQIPMQNVVGGATTSQQQQQQQQPQQDAERNRFIAELEFVQCLANPNYICFLAQHGYFKKPEFINYIKYLEVRSILRL